MNGIALPALFETLGRGRWALPVFAVALLLMGSLALAACGGGDEDTSGDSAQPTAAPDQGSNDNADTPTPAPASGNLTPTGSFMEEDLILPQQWESFEVTLVVGDRVVATYTSVPKAVGGFAESGAEGRPGLVFNINDPVGDSIYRGEQIADGGAEFVAELNGNYELTFYNPVVRNLQQVTLNYEINP